MWRAWMCCCILSTVNWACLYITHTHIHTHTQTHTPHTHIHTHTPHTHTSNLCIALHGVPIVTLCLLGNATEHTAMSVTPQACFKVSDDFILCFFDNGISCLYIECWHGEEEAWWRKLEHFKWGNLFFGTVFLTQRKEVIYQSKSIHRQWSEIENIHKYTPSSEIRMWKCYGIA